MLQKPSLLLILGITIACGFSEAKRSYSGGCQQRLKGEWKFGKAPFGCLYRSPEAQEKYSETTYNDESETVSEQKRYVQEMHDFLVDASTAYLKRRERDASPQDVEDWVRLTLATAHQESYWSHYRLGKDKAFRFFRGDSDHGYGMMQVDDRWHKKIISSGKVYDLTQHLVYSFDLLYDQRKRIKRSPCRKASGADALNRSIYSAYNGGPASQCRWQTSNHKWSRNDRNFYQKYNDRGWESLLTASNEEGADR